jgi:flagellar basal body-associated protein FliL
MKNLKKNWKMFLNILLDPFVLLFTTSIIMLFHFSNELTKPLFEVLLIIASGILGGRLTRLWEDSLTITRGKSAVRDLKLLLTNISVLKQKAINFQNSEEQAIVIKRNYKEIESFCGVLEEAAVNSIENWIDIVPEADIKTQIGIISDLNQSLKDKERELLDLNNKYSAEKFKSEEGRKQLSLEIKEKESQITNLEKEIRQNSLSWPYQPGLLSSLLDTQNRRE